MGKCSGWKASRVSNGRVRRGSSVGLGLLAALAAVPTLAVEPPAAEKRPALRYREALGHAVVVPVYLNGRGPFDLVLDTATRFTTLEPGLVAELGLQPLGRVPRVTIAGAHMALRSRLDHLTLGSLELSDVEVLSAELPALRGADPKIRGLLGQTALSRLSFGLDHARRRVFFDRPARVDVILPLVEREGRPAVSFALKGSTAVLSLVLDSGLPAPVLFEKSDSRLPLPKVPGYFDAETNSGTARLSAARLEGRIGRLAFPAALAAVRDDEAAGGRAEDGLLPTRSFRSLYFDRLAGELLLAKR